MANDLWRMKSAALILALSISACAAQPEISPAPAAPVSYDGQYQGTVTLTGVASGADRNWCEVPPQFAVQVTGNGFSLSQPLPNLPGYKAATYTAKIGQDGIFQGQSNTTGVIAGQIRGGTMTGTIDGVGCAYQFTASRL